MKKDEIIPWVIVVGWFSLVISVAIYFGNLNFIPIFVI